MPGKREHGRLLAVRARLIFAAVLLLAAGPGRAPAVDTGPIQPGGSSIRFGDNLDAALQDAAAGGRKVALYFWSPRCPWCHKLETVTFVDGDVTAIAGRLIWVRTPEARQNVLSAQYGVVAYPTVIVLDSQGRAVASQVGYLPPKEFAAFLRKAMATEVQGADEGVAKLAAALLEASSAPSKKDLPKAVRAVVERLAESRLAGRESLIAAVAKAGPSVRTELLSLMDSRDLSIRAAAYGALARTTGKELPFDPFAEPAVRAAQAAAWRERLSGPASAPAGKEESK